MLKYSEDITTCMPRQDIFMWNNSPHKAVLVGLLGFVKMERKGISYQAGKDQVSFYLKPVMDSEEEKSK